MKRLIHQYFSKFARIFEKEKTEISECINNIEIHHISSTSVPGLGGKGIVDIMIGIKNWKELENVIKKLRNLGFKHIHPKERGRVFLSRVGPTKLNDTHIHIVIENGKQYKELLMFRDYLRNNKKEVKRFFKLKKEWALKTKENRQEYGKLKRKYIEKILKKQLNYP